MTGRELLALLRRHGGVVSFETVPLMTRDGRRGYGNTFTCVDGFRYTPRASVEAQAVALVRSGEEPSPVMEN